MEETKTESPFFIRCVLYEVITVLIIALSLLTIRFLSTELFGKVKKYYTDNLLYNATAKQVLGGENADEV